MKRGTIKLTYAADGPGMYTLQMENLHIQSQADIALWEEEMTKVSDALLARRQGRKWLCLVDLAGFSLNPDVAPVYGQRAKAFMGKYFTGAVRYGDPQGLCTKSALSLGAMKNHFPSNLFRDREAALAFVEALQAA